MIQKHSEILSDELKTLSVESEYPGVIFSEEPIPPEEPILSLEPIFSEEPIPPEESVTPLGSIFPVGSTFDVDPIQIDIMPPIEFINPVNWVPPIGFIKPGNWDPPRDPIPPKDPLTGIVNDPTGNATGYIYNGGVVLKDARLNIDPLRPWEGNGFMDGFSITATIKVELDTPSPLPFGLMGSPVNLTLQSSVWGIDGVSLDFFNKNDHLFDFPDQKITKAGYYTFQKDVPRGVLSEDDSWLDRKDEISVSIGLVNSAGTWPANKNVWTPIVSGKF
jgi:hypothetical protein